MTATAAPPAAAEPGETAGRRPRRKRSVKQWLTAILGLQVTFALILFGADLARALPQILWPSTAPRLTEPVAPGDQTRRFTPGDLPARPAPPGGRPMPATADMPRRLSFDTSARADMPALSLIGEIAPGDAARFADWLVAEGPAETEEGEDPLRVYLHSPGGSVYDALAIGRMLRARGAETRMTAADICLSACPYILAAGTVRRVEDGAWVGVHQHYFGENTALPAFMAVADIQRGQGEVMAYLEEMGIDPLVMKHALVTPPAEIYLLLPEEMERYRLVTAAEDE